MSFSFGFASAHFQSIHSTMKSFVKNVSDDVMRPSQSCSVFKHLKEPVFEREWTYLLLPWGLGNPLLQGGGPAYRKKDWSMLPSSCNYNPHYKLEDYQLSGIEL